VRPGDATTGLPDPPRAGCERRDERTPGEETVGLRVVGVDKVDNGFGLSGPVRETFRKVMVHLTSSPAKTTCSCQRTKTRISLVAPPWLSGSMVGR
jgi:hypothetical protein